LIRKRRQVFFMPLSKLSDFWLLQPWDSLSQ
jgi:hypothetical protein